MRATWKVWGATAASIFAFTLSAGMADLSPVLAAETPVDARLQEIVKRIQEAEAVVAAETNAALRAVAEKRRDLLKQDLENMGRRLALERREQERREKQKSDPLNDLKAMVLAVQGDVAVPRRQAKAFDDQYRQLRAEQNQATEQLAQLRQAEPPDAAAIENAERILRFNEERLTLALLQRQLAEAQAALMSEAGRIAERMQVEPDRSPTIKALLNDSREIRSREKKLVETAQRVAELEERLEDVRAGLSLSQARATQLNEAIAIRREQERIERGRSRLFSWLSSTDEEKLRALGQQQIKCQEEQAHTVEAARNTVRQLRDLELKEIEWLRFRWQALRRAYQASVAVPGLSIAAILTLHLALRYLILPIFARRDRLFVFRRNLGYATALLILVVLVRFFLEDLKDIGTVLGIAGAALVIALQDLCSAFAGWFVIVASGKVRVGDRVEIGGVLGDVIDIQLLRTTLNELNHWMRVDEPTGRVVAIPNSFIFKEKVVNLTHVHPYVWSRLDIIVTFETPAIEARETLWKILQETTRDVFEEAREAARQMEKRYGAQDATYEPKLVNSIDDSGVTFGLLYITHYRQRSAMRNRLNERIIEEFSRNPRLQFAYPTTRQIPTPEADGLPVKICRTSNEEPGA